MLLDAVKAGRVSGPLYRRSGVAGGGVHFQPSHELRALHSGCQCSLPAQSTAMNLQYIHPYRERRRTILVCATKRAQPVRLDEFPGRLRLDHVEDGTRHGILSYAIHLANATARGHGRQGDAKTPRDRPAEASRAYHNHVQTSGRVARVCANTRAD